MNFVAIVKLVVSLIPTIIAAVDMIEDMFPEGGKGAQKLEMIKGILEKADEFSDKAEASFEKVWPALQKVIAIAVAMRK